ncbi:MAG TPA: hypothetical protein VK666_30610 [Chryseolinea sp.]|nr:hypothetical protein [Chryseolinea sp.]
MIKSCLTLFAQMLVLVAMAQSEIKTGDTAFVSGHHIVKLNESTKKSRGYVVVEYINQKQIIERNHAMAQQEAWQDARKKEAADYTEQHEKGGSVIFSIYRASIETADPKWFTIVIKKNEAELLRTRFTTDTHPVSADNGYWRLLKGIPIPALIAYPFDVHLLEAGNEIIQFRVLD